MKLTDFYFEEKAQVGNRMPILLPEGTDSGEWLNIVSPEADAAVKAGRAFMFAYSSRLNDLEKLKGPEETGPDGRKSYGLEYTLALGEMSLELNRQLAAEIINGWSFDEPFIKEGVKTLLQQYLALGNQVADFHFRGRAELDAK